MNIPEVGATLNYIAENGFTQREVIFLTKFFEECKKDSQIVSKHPLRHVTEDMYLALKKAILFGAPNQQMTQSIKTIPPTARRLIKECHSYEELQLFLRNTKKISHIAYRKFSKRRYVIELRGINTGKDR